MIPIKHKNLKQFADDHYAAIENYILSKKGGPNILTINNWIKAAIGSQYNFKTLVTSEPKVMHQILIKWKDKHYRNKTKFRYFQTLYSYLGKGHSQFKTKNGKDYNTNYLFSRIGISVCPYCNENYTYNIEGIDRNFDLDHFYDKMRFPILSISFFNLIPSCKVCNFFKLGESNEFSNPYSGCSSSSMKFSLKIKSSDYLYSIDEFEILTTALKSISKNEKRRISNNIKTFRIKGRYKLHKDIVLDTLQRFQIYNDTYIDDLFLKFQGKLFKNKEDVRRLLYGTLLTEDDFSKKPLSKLTRDIFDEINSPNSNSYNVIR